MYLRKNKVRSRTTTRTYLSIAHNVWHNENLEANKKAQSRPVVLVSLGTDDNVDLEVAHELIPVLEQCLNHSNFCRGAGAAGTRKMVLEARRLEELLRMLASQKLELRKIISNSNERFSVMETLMRNRLEVPTAPVERESLLEMLQQRQSAPLTH